ncbi:MAG: ComEC/Rec2 family competence protein [Bryobacteraceae bacterium]
MIFSLESLQAGAGDCLLLHYGSARAPRFLLIDGGEAGTYAGTLKPRLESLHSPRLELALVSHIDDDHIHGVLDLLDGLVTARQRSEPELCEIAGLWHNSFDRAGSPGPASVAQGAALRAAATSLCIPVNDGFATGLVAAEEAAQPLDFNGLKLTVLGPRQAALDDLRALWKKERTTACLADFANRTAENLSSIVVLAEFKRARMLLPGDCGGDLIIEALERRGLMPRGGQFAVDLMKAPHHASQHSLDQAFFERIPAKYYLISGNGKHGLPHPDALAWLSAARAGQHYHAVLTHRTGEHHLTAHLTRFLKSEAQNQPQHRYHFRNGGDLSIRVDLLDRVRYLKNCTEV